MKDFAKIFNSEKYGQIVVIQDENDDGIAQLKFLAQPEGLGVCDMSINFDASNNDIEQREYAFSKLTAEMAEKIIKPLMDMAD